MPAVVQKAYGLDAVELQACPIPQASAGQVRVLVTAASLNPMDWHLAVGSPGIVRMVEGFRRPKHAILGREICGVVDQVGAEASDFEIGQRVFGWVTGGFATYALAQADRLWLAPEKAPDAECAVLPIAGATALEAVDLGEVLGTRVLINGASGGVGHFAVQIAKALGASWVAGVCSNKNVEFVRSLGADQVFDYEAEDFTSETWDVMIDCIGNRTGAEIRSALVQHGRWVVVGDPKKDGLLGPLPRLVARLLRWKIGSQTCHWFVQGEEARYLSELAALVNTELVRPHVSEVLSMRDVRDGLDRIESGRTVGKIAVEIG